MLWQRLITNLKQQRKGPAALSSTGKKNHNQKTLAFYLALSFLKEAISWNEQEEEEFIPSERAEITTLHRVKEGAFILTC